MPDSKPLTDQHKLSIPAYTGAIQEIISGLFGEARQQGLRLRLSVTLPGTVLNDGTGQPYVDLSEPDKQSARWVLDISMDSTEPLLFPPLTQP